ncbi:MAG: VCBS repeat-containing protein, partial [Acidobacteriota bacterium]|nr:VCBS repeat-containing protein [Acidobacteriota bacterium]
MKKQFVLICVLLFMFSAFLQAETVGDFDGDRKTDPLVWRRINEGIGFWEWHIYRSGSSSHQAVRWGINTASGQTDLQALGDYDGDGKTDIAVWRTAFVSPPVQTYFYILRSSDATLQFAQWGLSSDFQMSQDYDGDGITDIAVVRPSAQGRTWYMLQSRNGLQTVFLKSGGFPLRGDYDGDGRADFALAYSDGDLNWNFYIVHSRRKRALFKQFGLGLADYVVPGDYDGDRKTDIA